MLLFISQKASWSGRSSSQSYQPVSSSSPSSSWSWWSTRSGGFLRDPLHGSQTCFSSLFLFSPCWFQSWGFLFISPRKVYTTKTQNKSTLSESVGGCTVEHVAIHIFTLALNFNTLLEGTNETNMFLTKPGNCQNQNSVLVSFLHIFRLLGSGFGTWF